MTELQTKQPFVHGNNNIYNQDETCEERFDRAICLFKKLIFRRIPYILSRWRQISYYIITLLSLLLVILFGLLKVGLQYCLAIINLPLMSWKLLLQQKIKENSSIFSFWKRCMYRIALFEIESIVKIFEWGIILAQILHERALNSQCRSIHRMRPSGYESDNTTL